MKRWSPIAFPGPDDTHVNANMSIAQRGSWPDGDGYQQMLDELCAVVSKSGMTLDGAVSTQIAQAIRSQSLNYRVAAGTANALTVTLDPAPPSYAALTGAPIRIKVSANNTGAVTLNVNGLGAKAITRADGTALAANDLVSGAILDFVYDGTSFQVSGLMSVFIPATGVQVFAAPGTVNWTVPTGVTRIKVRIWAGGGGGGGATTTTSGAAGGNGGGYREATISVTPGQVIPITVGAGGIGGTGTGSPLNGAAGGSSSVGALATATGGGGGNGGSGTSYGTASATLGTSSGAGWGVDGMMAANAAAIGSTSTGTGGGGSYGTTNSAITVTQGTGASFPGGGGGGAAGGYSGKPGSNGLVIIEF
ncbi:hypothetical protein GCM10019059_07810 [Camelimonas fluminis]|uniref:Glycine-rich domain-containing protein n=1 Tax=Camelimonas fluminis TaxID=1576911 RepID=A0ABV7UG07_9HYPH|nr:hypothetical protein [Camelimonas fluminis]GHE51052.1 hypothetical protein GCM10019059_07810 [Camelimonas fluminis]